MARSRNIKPGFFSNDALSELPALTRLLFIGLWTIADREGRIEDRPKKIRAEVLPYDECDVGAMLEALSEAGFIDRYAAGGVKAIRILNWHKHQTPHHMEVPSDIPPPDGEANRYNHAPLTKPQRERIMRRDKGKCVLCGATERLHVDHIDAISGGGSSEDSNLRILCSSCNVAKGKNESISSRRQEDIKETSTRHKVDYAPLIPDSGFLIPDSSPLIPDSLKDTHTSAPRPVSVCVMLRAVGLSAVNAGHPDLIALCEAGCTDAEFTGAAAECVSRGKGFAYLLAMLTRQRINAQENAEKMARGEMPANLSPAAEAARSRVAAFAPRLLAGKSSSTRMGVRNGNADLVD